MFAEHALERAALEAAERVLAVHREDLAERRAGFLLHLAFELDERHSQRLRELRAERRLARAAQAEQRDRPLLRVVLAHQPLDADAHRARHLAQEEHRHVALARLELCEVALGDAGGHGELLARHAMLGAPGAHALAKPGEEGVFLLLCRERSVHEI